MGFVRLVHSVFFGKAVKMAQGHEYTHAHRVPLDLGPLARLASERGYEQDFCRSLAEANTARHAMDHLISRNAADIVCAIAREALEQSARISGHGISVRLLLFDYSGKLLADLET